MAKFVRQQNSQKWGDFTHDNESHIMTLADMDLPLYEPFKKSILKRLEMSNNFTYKNISKDCYRSIIKWYEQRHIKSSSTVIKEEQIVETPSVLNIIYLLVGRLTTVDDGILLLIPVYNYYDRISTYLKRSVFGSRLYSQRVGCQIRYDIDFTDLAEKAKHCKIMLFCNPHNPSGRIWNQREVEKIVGICQKNNVLIISDEILSDLIPQKHFDKFYSLINSPYKRIIVCNSISKTFNAQSLRGGYAIIKDELVLGQYREVTSYLNQSNNEFAMICTEIFYSSEGLDWIAYSLSIIRQNYEYLLEKIEATLLTVSQLEAAYILTINFQGYLKFLERWYNHLKEKESAPRNIVSYFLGKQGIRGIQLIYGSIHGGVLTDIRLTIAIEPDLFRKFADKLRACLLQLEYRYREMDPKL